MSMFLLFQYEEPLRFSDEACLIFKIHLLVEVKCWLCFEVDHCKM